MARIPRTVMTKVAGPFFPSRPGVPLTAPRERRERKPPSIFELREKVEEKAAEATKVEPSASAAQSIVKHVQDSGKTGAEAGYILERLIASASSGEVKKPSLLATLSTEQKKWYDKQVGQYQDLMTECKARYKAELQILKDKCGDDARKYTNARLKLKAKIYPDWSSQARQAEAKFEERQDKMADAISAAKKAGVTGLSYDEIYSLATTTKKGAAKYGEELGLEAKQISIIRGEKVAEAAPKGVTIEPETKEQPVKVIGATAAETKKAEEAMAEAKARGWSCTTTLQSFKVKLRDGSVIEVVTLDSPSRSGAGSAREKAEAAGYKVAFVTKKMAGETIKPTSKLTGAYNVTLEDGTKTTMVPFVYSETKEILLMPKDFASEIKETDAYKNATGTTEQKLGTAYTAQTKEFEAWLDGLKRDYPDIYKTYEAEGYDALNKSLADMKKQQASTMATLDSKYKRGEGYDLVTALWDKVTTVKDLKDAGFDAQAVDEVEKVISNTQSLDAEFQKLPSTQQTAICAKTTNSKSYENLNFGDKLKVLDFYSAAVKPGGWTAFKYSQQKGLQEAKQMLIALTPIVGTVHYWDRMATWEKVLSIVGDVACFIPIIAGAASGARATKGYTAGARMKAAVQGAGAMALAEVTAPAEIIFKPVATAKGIGRQVQSIAETLAHPRKLPLGGMELAYTTARLPVDDIGGAKKAMQLRDAAVAAAIQGKPATVKIGDVSLSLTPSELQKVGGAMAVHATPDIRPYLNGAVVKAGAEGSGMFISPNFHSRFAQATAFGDIPTDGIRGGLIIRDTNVLKALTPSGKVYRGAAEIEALLKPGTVLPSPSQILVTRDAAGHRLTLLVIGKPFTQAQVAKLKLLGSMDTIGQIFKPTMKLTGAEKSAVSSMDELISLSKQRAAAEQQLIAARAAGRIAEVQTLGQRVTRIDTQLADLVTRVNVPRETIRSSDLVWAEYGKGILERWRELNPNDAKVTPRGTRLPDIKAGETIRNARATLEQSRIPPGARRAQPVTEGRRPIEYKRLAMRTYTPQRIPPYTPQRIPPYTPVYAPKRGVPHVTPTVPYVPPRLSRISVTRVPVTMKPARRKMGLTSLGKTKLPGDSLVSWRQGIYYVTVVEPYRTTGNKPDVIYSRQRPPWARVVKGRRSPQKTLKSIGKVPVDIKLPMGATTARVKHGKVLKFHRRRG